MIRGRSRTLGLGGFALVTLSEGREAALANRKLARSGGDPLAARRCARVLPPLEEAAVAVLGEKRGSWRNAKDARGWPTSRRRYVFPQLGEKPVSEVTSADVLQVLAPIWRAKPETARRVPQRIGAIMKWAVAIEHRADNPAGKALGEALGRQQDVVRHMPALPHVQVATAVEAVRASGPGPARSSRSSTSC